MCSGVGEDNSQDLLFFGFSDLDVTSNITVLNDLVW